jgi:hypothetical protein
MEAYSDTVILFKLKLVIWLHTIQTILKVKSFTYLIIIHFLQHDSQNEKITIDKFKNELGKTMIHKSGIGK